MNTELKPLKAQPNKIRIFKIQFIVFSILAFLIGIAWGYKIQHGRAIRAQKPAPISVVRVLSLSGLISKDLENRFESSTGHTIELKEVKNPEELWAELESQPTTNTPGYDLVTLFSYQLPLAFQLSHIQPIQPGRLRDWSAVSPDFRNLPGQNAYHSALPILWGVVGLLSNPKVAPAPLSWLDFLDLAKSQVKSHAKSQTRVKFLSSTTEILRLHSLKQRSEKSGKTDLKQFIRDLQFSHSVAEDFIISHTQLESSNTLKTKDLQADVHMMDHGSAAFLPQSMNDWIFQIPEEGGPLWITYFALHSRVQNVAGAYALLDHLLLPDTAELLTSTFRQASTNRLIEDRKIDARLKPSYLRQIPLNRIQLIKEYSRAPEIRMLLENREPK